MAVTDPYATVTEYRELANVKNSDNDLLISVALNAASRYIDKICKRFFSVDDAVSTRYYDGDITATSYNYLLQDGSPAFGSSLLTLYDDISTTTGLVVVIDNDGDNVLETTLTLNTHFWVSTYNALYYGEPEPFTALQLIPDNALGISVWPARKRSVSITAYWGWPAVPSAVKMCTLLIARELLDLGEAGVMQSLNLVDAALPIQRRTASIVDNMLNEYKRRIKLFV